MSTIIVCQSTAASCWCQLEDDHEGDHECECGGRWQGSDHDGTFTPTRLPMRGVMRESGLSDIFDTLFGPA